MKDSDSGLSMIEMLIAMVLASIILLVCFSAYLDAMQKIKTSQYLNFVNREIASAASAILSKDRLYIKNWQSSIEKHLPLGHGEISYVDGIYRIEISWFDQKAMKKNSREMTVVAI